MKGGQGLRVAGLAATLVTRRSRLATALTAMAAFSAKNRLPGETLTAWIAMDGKASRRPIEENGTWKNHWVITGGVEAGEWLLVDGIAQIRDGQPLELTPATIDAGGVVRDSDPAQVGN